MVPLHQTDLLKRAAAMLLIFAVAVLPLVHAGHANADIAEDTAALVSQADPCGCCDDEPEGPQAPASDDDAPCPCDENDHPCNCPCCGNVLPVVSMMNPLCAGAPFWGETPALLPIHRDARPEAVAMRVDIQPPIQ